jgi:uroporphyrin-III C-methyltransferase
LQVTLVGIGPGNPQLLTLQAADVISRADVVRHQPGCEEAILAHAADTADVARYAGPAEIVTRARAGTDVAVLFRGDPYAFSDGAALAERLVDAGIDFDVVPGVLVETAAAALGGVPLTLEGRSASVAIGAVAQGDSIVLRLADGWWEAGVDLLLRAGHAPAEQAALLSVAG